MKKKVFIHIGYSKTGTSALQHFLFNNRERLKSCYGALYPESCFNNNHRMNHQNLSHTLLKRGGKTFPKYIDPKNYSDDPDFFWHKLIEEVKASNCDKIIISSEAFIRFRGCPDLIEKIRNYFFDYDVKIICYLRRQDEFFESGYNQQVKANAYIGSIRKFVNERLVSIDYYNDIIEWANVFGNSNIIVRIYSSHALPNGIVPDFLKVLNIEIEDYISSNCINIRLPNRYVYVKRFLNKIRFQKFVSDDEINSILIFMGKYSSKEYSLISINIKSKIHDYYSDSNRKLGNKFFNGVFPFEIDNRYVKTFPVLLFPFDLFFFFLFFVLRKIHLIKVDVIRNNQNSIK